MQFPSFHSPATSSESKQPPDTSNKSKPNQIKPERFPAALQQHKLGQNSSHKHPKQNSRHFLGFQTTSPHSKSKPNQINQIKSNQIKPERFSAALQHHKLGKKSSRRIQKRILVNSFTHHFFGDQKTTQHLKALRINSNPSEFPQLCNTKN